MTGSLFNTLLENSSAEYKAFTEKLVPSTLYPVLGVRVPTLKAIAKQSVKDGTYLNFLKEKHVYYEEYFVHGLIIGYMKTDLTTAFKLLDEFLPFVDNWAICDSTASNLTLLKKHKDQCFDRFIKMSKSDKVYVKRFAIVFASFNYTQGDPAKIFLTELSEIHTDEYYINMAIGWYISTCLIKDYQNTLPFIQNKTFDKFVHNKGIQKAVESFRISDEQKEYLKTLKIK